MFVLPVALLAATLACGSSTTTEVPAKQPDAATEKATEASTKEPDQGNSKNTGKGGSVSLDIKNEGNTDICEVFIAAVDDKSWGKDQLDTKKILPNETFTLTDIPEGKYDLQALDCDGNVVATANKQDLAGSDFTWTVQSDTVILTVNNKSDSIGCKIYVAAPDDKYWGQNLVKEGDKINPGDTYEIRGITPGTYDVHAETCSGNYTWDWPKVDLTTDGTVNMNN